VEPILNKQIFNQDTKLFINPSGRFVIGGPEGDTGLTGRKIIVDTYGGVARHGGGAFSGKDPSKVDRSASYAARWVAKTIVAAGLADRCEFTVSYAIGVAEPMAMNVELFGTGNVPKETIISAVKKEFDLRPTAIIRDLKLAQPFYENVACYGHFGRNDLNLPWEDTSKAAALAKHANLTRAT
jgi:S-adenosylmethionine synthetase